MSAKRAIAGALCAWREAERRLSEGLGSPEETRLRADTERRREAYRRLSAEQSAMLTDDGRGQRHHDAAGAVSAAHMQVRVDDKKPSPDD